MRVELPECKRCCCCVPLRYGLIVFGYINMIISCWALIGLSFYMDYLVRMYYADSKISVSDVVIHSLIIALFGLQIIMSVMFIVGCHMKSVRIMKIYYYYAISFLLFVSVFFIKNIFSYGFNLFSMEYYRFMLIYTLLDLSISFLIIAMQLYMILLIRSEMIKLNNGAQFRFVNNAVEAECNLDMEQQTYTDKVEKNMKDTNSEEEIRIYV